MANRPFSTPAITSGTVVASGNFTFGAIGGSSGHLLVAIIGYRSNATFTVPGDWNLIGTQQSSGNTTVNGTGSIASGLMAWCIRGASDPTLTWNRTGGDVAFGRVLRYAPPSGMSWASTPLDVSTTETMGAAGTSITGAAFTTSYETELLVAAAIGARNVTFSGMTAATAPTGASGSTLTTSDDIPDHAWTERVDAGTTTGADGSIGVFDAIKATAASTGGFTVTASASAQHVFLAAAFKLASTGENDLRATKVQGYALLAPDTDKVSASKLQSYAVLGPAVTEIRVSKLQAYAVVKPVATRRRSIVTVT